MEQLIRQLLGWFAGLVDRLANWFLWQGIRRQTDTMGLMGS